MFKIFYPCEYVESVFSIDYNKLYDKGYRGIMFDIDNTLVPHGNDSTTEIDALFQFIHSIGLKTLILSNNDEERVKRFLKKIDSLYICDAEKPRTENYFKAIEMMNIKKDEALVVGDQIFTDILGANRCGIDSILVKYIGYYIKEKKGIRRNLEKIILGFYDLSKLNPNKPENIQKRR